MIDWKEVEEHAVEEYEDKAGETDFRNRLLGNKDLASYSIYHHYGVGKVDNLDEVLERADGDEIKKILYNLENNQSIYLIGMLEGAVGKDSKVLDCGSGSGGPAFNLHNKYGCSVTGINIAKKQVEFTNQLASLRGVQDKVKFLNMNMRDMKFEEDSFDAAITSETTMYVEVEGFYSQLSKILKNHGKYAMTSWCRADDHIDDNEYADKIDDYYKVNMQSVDAHKSAIEKNNFKILQFEDLGERCVDYWKLRIKSPVYSDIDVPFLEGYEKGYLKYFSILAEVSK